MRWLIALIAAVAAMTPLFAASDPIADFYRGKQVSLFIGTTPGGGYDGYARVLARHLGKHIPGGPSIVPRNMPGAGGLTVANYMFNKAAADGLEIAALHNGIAFEKLFQTLPPGSAILFDPTRFGWIGSATQTVFVTVTWHTASVKTLAEAQSREVLLGATALGSDNYLLAVLGNNMLGTKFRIVTGYDGSTSLDLAIERGEVEGAAGKDWTTVTSSRAHWLTEKKINIIVQMGMRPHPDLPGTPFALDHARSPEDRKALELIFAKYGMARPYIAPPGVAVERLEILRRAFDATMADPEFLVDAGKAGMEINPVTGEDVQRLVENMMGTPDALAARARAALAAP